MADAHPVPERPPTASHTLEPIRTVQGAERYFSCHYYGLEVSHARLHSLSRPRDPGGIWAGRKTPSRATRRVLLKGPAIHPLLSIQARSMHVPTWMTRLAVPTGDAIAPMPSEK